MSALIDGTFATASGTAGVGSQQSGVLVVPTGTTAAKLTLAGEIGASNTCKTQKSTNNGSTWADVTTYNSAQAGTSVSVAAGEHWRLLTVAMVPLSTIAYRFSAES